MKTIIHLRVFLFLTFVPTLLYAQYNWENFIYHHNVNRLLIDDSNLWIGTSDAGLICRNIKTGKEVFFDSDNGFIGDKIISIVKGMNNKIWAANSKMVSSYNDNKWMTYNISGNQIVSLAADSFGSIWVACEKSIAKQSGDHFDLISIFDSLRQADEYPKNIVAGPYDSSVYIQTGKRIFCLNLDGTCRSIIDIPISNPLNITIDNESKLFVTNIDTVGVYTTGKWLFYSTGDKSLPIGVRNLITSPQGNVWAFGLSDVLTFDSNNWKVFHKHELGSGLITVLAPLNKDSAWVGGNFLGFLTTDSLCVINPNTPKNNNKFIYADKQGTIWVQVTGDNIIQYKDNTWDYVNSIFGTLGKNTIKMIQMTDGSYCFLQPRNVLFYGKKYNGITQKYIVGSGFVPSGILNDLIEDNYGQLWFATTNGVIKNWSNTFFDMKNSGCASNNIKVLLLRKDSSIWAGGDSGTLACFKDSSWTPQNLPTNYYVSCLAEDSSQGLWIGTNNGLIRLSDNNQTIYTVANGLGDNTVKALLIDKDNRVWVGTYNGLSCFEKNVWTTFRRPCGIAGNSIFSIVQNIDGVIWIGTDRGISALQISSLDVLEGKAKSFRNKNKIIQFFSFKDHFDLIKENSYFLLNGKKSQPMLYKKRKFAANSCIIKHK